MIDLSTDEWKTALRLVRAAFDDGTDASRAAAFDFLRTAESKRLIGLAHLLQPGTTPRAIQAALVPLERVDKRTKITDAEMGIRTTDNQSRPGQPPSGARLAVVADNLRSAFNAGGIFRTADFFGVERLVLCGYTPGPENPQVKKTALGADETVPWEHAGDIRDVIDRLHAEGYVVYALETADGAADIAAVTPTFPCALLLGNERFGLDPDVVAAADAVLEIPSHGMKNSLNVVSAFAVAAAFFRRFWYNVRMKKQFILSFTLAFGLAAFGITFNVEKGIRYSDAAARCVLDVKWPDGVTNFATVVNFHGGGLVGGNKHFARWPDEATDKDPVAFVGANYRLLKDKKTGETATPEECVSDAAAAVAWTLDNIARYGGDPKKVFVTGISGGGYLTAMIGLDPKWLARYGHAPADLAGIAPMTGQMTKHFNVRKVGFRDSDPQFQPKVDEWAPLAYAGGTNLPPACFLTGGRDVEWKCRVEENELLAASLRSCGYPKTEFHETEGNHGGGVRPSAYFLRDFVMKTCDTGAVGRFADGERVLFCGDSITHGGKFVYYLQVFQDLRHPGSNVRLINGGRSGDTAHGGLRRFDRDILSFKADRAFVMFGMNDINRNVWKSSEPSEKESAARKNAVDGYRTNMTKLVDRFLDAGMKTVLITPSPFDQYGVFEKENIPFCNDPGLSSCATIVRDLAAARNLGLVEFHAPLTQLFKDHATDFHFCKDRVHPGDEGHLIMAALVLEEMHVSPLVARVQIDAAKGTVAKVGHGETMNAVVTALRASPNELAFTYAPKALPFPKLPEYEKADTFYPLTERLNQEVLAVTGLASGNYDLAYDGVKIGTFSADDFAAGVNVALLDTPNQKRAQALAAPMRRLQENQSHFRKVILVQIMLQDNNVDANDRAAADAWLANWLEKQKTSEWYNGLKAWVEGYQSGRDEIPSLQAEADDLYEQMGAVRPAVSRVTIRPGK